MIYQTKSIIKIIAFAVLIAVCAAAATEIFAAGGKQNRSQNKQLTLWKSVDRNITDLPSRGQLGEISDRTPVYRLNRTLLNGVFNRLRSNFPTRRAIRKRF